MASIQIIEGINAGDYFPIADGTIVVGRGDDCTIQLRDAQVSRRHIQIRFDKADESFFIKDLQSANGVFVNGERITNEEALGDNDTILIGESKLLFSTRSEDDIPTVF